MFENLGEPEVPSSQDAALRERLKPYVAPMLASASGGAFAGASIARHVPASVHITPDINIGASFSDTSGVTATYGPASLQMPNMPAHVPEFLGHGVHIDVEKANIDPSTIAAFASKNIDLAHPIHDALVWQIAKGAGIGAIACASVTGGVIKFWQMRKEIKHSKLRAQAAEARITSLESGEIFTEPYTYEPPAKNERKPSRLHLPKKVVAVLGAFALIAGGQAGEAVAEHVMSNDATATTPLTDTITSQVPEMRGARISNDPLGRAVNLLGYGAIEIKNETDNFWGTTTVNNLETSMDAFKKAGNMDYMQNPDIVPILHVSDLHCNYAYLTQFFGHVLRTFQPGIILNTGDTYTNSKPSVIEQSCYSAFTDQVQKMDEENGTKTDIVNVWGNHDIKDSFSRRNPHVVTLDHSNDYHATIDNIIFVGDTDPELTLLKPPQASEQATIDKKLAVQGSHIADTACDIQAKELKAGRRPFIIAAAHREEATGEAIWRGCVDATDSGHTHKETGVRAYWSANNKRILQHTGGSAPGADIGFTYYETPKRDATAMVQLFNEATQQLEGFITMTVHTDGTITLTKQGQPQSTAPLASSPKIYNFLRRHNKLD